MRQEADLPVPEPIPCLDGSLLTQASIPGTNDTRYCSLLRWVKGRYILHQARTHYYQAQGRLMARMHLHARNYQLPDQLCLLHFDQPFPFPEPVVLFDEPYAALFPPERRAVFEKAIGWTQASIDRLQASGEAMRILHNDLRQ